MRGIGDQYRTIKAAAGWRRRQERGRLRVAGNDRHSFLQALLTNDIASLGAGQGCYAAYLTPQGRMIADLHVFSRADHIILDAPSQSAARLAEMLDQLVFTEDVAISDVSATISQISVIGGAAAASLGDTCGLDSNALSSLPIWGQLDAKSGFVAKTDDCVLPSFDIVIPAADEPALLEQLSRGGAAEISSDLWSALRIDAARPEFGVDMDTSTIPLEAGLLERAISTTKGCYVGQEVVIRVLHRGGGRVARRLVKVDFDDVVSVPLASGTPVHAAGVRVGTVTSAAYSLDGSHAVALASVHRDAAEIGRVLHLGDDAAARGTITAFAG